MEDPGASTRVEIELTPNDGSRPRRRRSGASTTIEFSGNDYTNASIAVPEVEPQLPGEEHGPQPVDQRKLVVAGVVIAIVALFVGWALGRSGGSSAADAPPSSTTVEPSATETIARAVVPSTVPTTTRPIARALPTTTTAPRWETATIDVDDSAAALDIRVVIVGGGQIAEIDTGSGEINTLATGTRYEQPPVVNAGADWIVIRDTSAGISQLVRTGERPVYAEVGDPWSTFFERDTGLFWKMQPTSIGIEPTDVLEIDHEGNETGRSFQLPAGVWPVAGDPAGGVVVSAPGGTYHAGPDGTRRLTTGNLMALSASVAVVTDCDDDFSHCGLYVVDRASGQRTELELSNSEPDVPIGVFDLASAAFWGNPELLSAVSPDDRWAPVLASGRLQEFGLLDLTTGEFVPFATEPPSGYWWTPDSRSLLYVQNNRLMLFDTELRSWTDIAPSSVGVDAFDVRP